MKTLELHDDAEHEAFDTSIEDLRKVIVSQRELMQSMIETMESQNQTIATLNSFMALTLTPKTEKRITKDFWLEKFNSTMKPEFIAANKFAKTTDTKVLTWWFVKEFSAHGISASRIRGKEFQGKLKSIRNMLSDARNPTRKNPIK